VEKNLAYRQFDGINGSSRSMVASNKTEPVAYVWRGAAAGAGDSNREKKGLVKNITERNRMGLTGGKKKGGEDGGQSSLGGIPGTKGGQWNDTGEGSTGSSSDSRETGRKGPPLEGMKEVHKSGKKNIGGGDQDQCDDIRK